ncbi:glutathione S-transferase family protein [Phaeovulum sp.]|uniref:glutathione S-transferase family protein n=1 Tax=Phaeovulum sp. TaxID=2934796 RepID=UPI00356AD6B3
MLTLYGIYRSRATRNIWLLAELGASYRFVPVIQGYRLPDPAAKDAPLNTTSPAFLAINPAGAVPVLDDDGFVLSESLAINLYLARKFGGTLAPSDAQEDALMQQWALYGTSAIEGPALEISYAYARGEDATEAGRAVIAAATQKLQRPFKVLEAHLAKTPHVVGGRFTVADINMAEMVRYAQAHAALMDAFPAVKGWLAACQARPAFKAMWEKRTAEPA